MQNENLPKFVGIPQELQIHLLQYLVTKPLPFAEIEPFVVGLRNAVEIEGFFTEENNKTAEVGKIES